MKLGIQAQFGQIVVRAIVICDMTVRNLIPTCPSVNSSSNPKLPKPLATRFFRDVEVLLVWRNQEETEQHMRENRGPLLLMRYMLILKEALFFLPDFNNFCCQIKTKTANPLFPLCFHYKPPGLGAETSLKIFTPACVQWLNSVAGTAVVCQQLNL